MWAMVSDHAYYPSISFFPSEDAATAAAGKEIAYMHAPDGDLVENSVSVVRVVGRALIKTKY
jgi:hypothetical protein